eukprot:7515467-Pyramimonas_sp.AAC.1
MKAAQERIDAEQAALTAYRADLMELEAALTKNTHTVQQSPTEGGPPGWLKDTLMDLARQIRTGSEMPRDALAAALEGMTLPPPAPMPPEASEPAPPASDMHMQDDSETP